MRWKNSQSVLKGIDNIRAGSLLILCVYLLASVAGCSNDPLYKKRWGGSQFGQGDVGRQAARAVYFDPYPYNDIGPEVVGGRPREFASPLSEAVRNELDSRMPNQAAPVFPAPGYPYR